MRIAILPALLPAVLLPAFAQDAKPAPASDPHVRQLLDELEYEYEVDEDGDYRLVFEVKLPADAGAKALDDAMDAAISSADAMEAELTPGKDEL